jgi:TolB-like protein/Tfp pilus assembly protein PilF
LALLHWIEKQGFVGAIGWVLYKRNSQSSLPATAEHAPALDGVLAQLERIVASRGFSRSDRLIRFLRFSVEQALEGHHERLKEQLIGIEVFDRKPDYDPRIDPIVRVEARRLRLKLRNYYLSAGREDPVVIALPKGAYVPQFRSRSAKVKVAAPAPAHKSIAVLPFANLTPQADDDYFSDGLTEELIHLLTRIPGLRVVAWNSAAQLRGRESDLAGIRERLNAAVALRGSVRRGLGRVRVTAQLIDTASGEYLWSQSWDREAQDVFSIQEQMAAAIVGTLEPALTLGQFPGLPRKAVNPECYNLCLQGRFHAHGRTLEGLRKSAACYEQAIAADSSSAVAYAGLADAYSLLVEYGLLDPQETMPKATSAAERALEIDPLCAEAHVSLAFIRSRWEWEWTSAEALYRRAIALNPGYSRARQWFGQDFLAVIGRFEEALAELRVACDLDPLSPIIHEGVGHILMVQRDYQGAVESYRQLQRMDATFYKAHGSLGRVLSIMGRYEEAIACFERARELGGSVPNILSALGQTLACAGRTAEACAYLNELRSMSKTQWVPDSSFAVVHMGLKEFDTALTYLEAAAERRELTVSAVKVHPLWDPLRGEPRFQKLLDRMSLR